MTVLDPINWAAVGLIVAMAHAYLRTPAIEEPLRSVVWTVTAAVLGGAISHVTGSYGAADPRLADMLTALAVAIVASLTFGAAARRTKPHP